MPNKSQSFVFSTISVTLLFIIWEIYSIYVSNATLIPSPFEVFNRLFELALSKQTYVILFSSLARMLLSLFLAIFLGVLFGLISGINTKVEAFLKPIIITIRTLPVISIIVVVLIIFGNEITLYIISLLLLFPIIYQAELDGIKHIDPRVVDVLKLETKKVNKVVVFNIYLPLSIPFLRTALIDAVGLGFKVLVIAEYIAQTNSSIGKTIYMNKINLDFTGVFAWTIVLLIFVLVIEWIVERVLKTK